MKYLFIWGLVCASLISCTGTREFKTPQGLVGYELMCSTPVDCENQAKDLCGSAKHDVETIEVIDLYEIKLKIVCTEEIIEGDWE